MEKSRDTFFAKLRKLAAETERDCEKYKKDISEDSEQSGDFSTPQAIKDILDMKTDVKQLKAPLLTDINKQKKNTQVLNDIATSGDCLGEFVSKKITEIEQYLLQYGYKRKGVKSGKENEMTEEDSERKENEDKETAVPNTPPNNMRPPDPNRTPRLEDAGISQGTLQYLNSLQKKKPATITAVSSSKMPSWTDIPSDFWHNGIICTPSLAKSLNADISYSTDLHSALASPVLLSAAKPMPVIEENVQVPPEHLQFNTNQTDSPASPQFRTPGIKQILTNTNSKKHESNESTHSNKRPLNVGLFQSDGKKEKVKLEIKEEPNVPDLRDEPVEPELTYSLEALTEMTGVFMINPVRKSPEDEFIKPFSMHASMVSDNKENATPPEPEMLTQRISRINIKQESQPVKDFVPTQTTINDDMPPSPKLFGNYNFL